MSNESFCVWGVLVERYLNRFVLVNAVSPSFAERIQQVDGYAWLLMFERQYDERMERLQNAWIARDAFLSGSVCVVSGDFLQGW